MVGGEEAGALAVAPLAVATAGVAGPRVALDAGETVLLLPLIKQAIRVSFNLWIRFWRLVFAVSSSSQRDWDSRNSRRIRRFSPLRSSSARSASSHAALRRDT